MYIQTTLVHATLNNARIVILDEDNSQLSVRVTQAFIRPLFSTPVLTDSPETAQKLLRSGVVDFWLFIPQGFERKILRKSEMVQLSLDLDASSVRLAFMGNHII